MDSLEINPNGCRICLDRNGILDWNEEVLDLYGLTYRDVYHKYTELENQVTDKFSHTLCETCSNDLKNAHLLFQKALRSHKILQQTFSTKPETNTEVKLESEVDFETVFIKQPTTESLEDNLNESVITSLPISVLEPSIEIVNENKTLSHLSLSEPSIEIPINCTVNINELSEDIEQTEEYTTKTPIKSKRQQRSKKKSTVLRKSKKSNIKVKKQDDVPKDLDDDIPKDLDDDITQNSANEELDIPKDEDITTQSSESLDSSTSENKIKDTANSTESKCKKKGSFVMCIYCSKLILSRNMKHHEETHKEHRERTITCSKCGIKLFTKNSLHNHMLTHVENREKKYKCEFCDKSYFNRGACNIHRRKHLGQMVPCSLCSKEFYRQVDLDRHRATAHSAAINMEPKLYIECKDCGKNIPSNIWKRHHYAHIKKFQLKCTICDKHFINKYSCHKHVKQVHKKTNEDFPKCVEYYGEDVNKRNIHLLLKQTETVKQIKD